MNNEKKRKTLLQGSVLKSIFMISLPIIFANILQMVYQLIDTFWVGRLGTEAVAAVSLSFPILFFIGSLAMGFTMAGAILISQYNGKGDHDNVCFSAGQTLSLVFLISIVISIVGYFSSGWLLSFLTKDALVLEQATSYLQISFLAIIAMFIYYVFQSSLQGIGEVKFPTMIVFITVVINFFIDPLFMFGWKFIPAMGVSGVALATLVTQYLSAIIAIIVLLRGSHHIKIKFKDLILKKSFVKRLFKLGMPSSLEMSARSLGLVLMTFIVSVFGTLVVASYGIGTRIMSFIIIPAVGFSIATSTLVGNNLGAKQYLRAEKIAKTGVTIGFWFLTAVGVLLFIFAKPISTFFVPGELELIKMSSNFIRIMALSFGFIGIQMAVVGVLKGAGKTSTSMFLAFFGTVVLFILSFVLAINYGLNELGVWIAYPVANLVTGILAFYFYKKKNWVRKIV